MANLAYPPCLKPGCKSPNGHPNCECFSTVSPSQLQSLGYQRPGVTRGMIRRDDPDTGKYWYAGPGNGNTGLPPKTPAQVMGSHSAIKFIEYAKVAHSTANEMESTGFSHSGFTPGYAKGGEIGPTHHPECHHYAEGGEAEALNEFTQNPDLAIDQAVVSHGLYHLLTKTGHSKSEDPTRVMNDHLEHFKRGGKVLQNHSKNIFDMKKEHHIASNPGDVRALKTHLEHLELHPHELLDMGGSLANALPDHAGVLGAKAATAVNYLQAIKPKSNQLNPMNEPLAPSKGKEMAYDRQLAIAENPSILYQEVKDGTVSPEDLTTVQAIYPQLFERMKNQTTESLIESKTRDHELSYKHRMGLGKLLGQPLDYSMSPQAMQAIIAANGPHQGQAQANGKPRQSGATAATQKTIEKSDRMYETPLNQRQIDRKN